MRHYDSVVDVNQCQRVGIRSCLLILFSFCQHPPQDEVLKYMSEAIISRRGGSSSTSGREMVTQYVTINQNWEVPNHIGNISVRLFGGGGSGCYAGTSSSGYSGQGGGSGWMNNADLEIENGTMVQITIGSGGINGTRNNRSGNTGGTTSFGTYLSANGGDFGNGVTGIGGNGGAGGRGRTQGGTGYQFGGGWGSRHGGDGGPWGGGGGGSISGGNGGTYGGGGGCMNSRYSAGYGNRGLGGTYGGNGGTNTIAAENGINTMNNSSVPFDCRGYGISGYNGNNPNDRTGYGGGGFGGNGGIEDQSRYYGVYRGTGGGGYGGDGGNNIGGGGGGGGGYGNISKGGGGGGGYYCPPGGINCNYNSEEVNDGGGGGFGLVIGGQLFASYGSGGEGYTVSGEPGICIVQYYI